MENEQEVQPGFVTLAEGTIASDYALKELNKALGLAQNEFLPAVKNEENAYGGYKYTPLSSIVTAVRPSLTKYHLTVSQFPQIDLESKTVTIHSRLVHWDSGEWMQNALELPAELALGKGGSPVFNQQTIGGSQTYAQKYAYKAIVGIPDSEEMIDSTEENGDLPARSKAKVARQSQALEAVSSVSVDNGTFTCIPVKVERKIFTRTTKATADKKAEEQYVPYVEVFFNGRIEGWNAATCWHESLHEILMGSKGIEIVCAYKIGKNNRPQIEDVFSVNGVHYENGLPKVADGN